jgi:hypothetical protein
MVDTGPDDLTRAWGDFAAAAPGLAEFGRIRLERRVAYLATVRADGAPRVHPVSAFFGGRSLFLTMEPTSPKLADLRRDARYALHCGVADDSGGGEFYTTGLAREVENEDDRAAVLGFARDAGYRPESRLLAFELGLRQVLCTTYDAGPRRRRWSASDPG